MDVNNRSGSSVACLNQKLPKMKLDWTDWVVIITFTIAMTLSIWYFFGHSPTEIQIVAGWLSFLSGWMIKHEYQNYKQLTEIERRLHDKLTDMERRLIDKIGQIKNG